MNIENYIEQTHRELLSLVGTIEIPAEFVGLYTSIDDEKMRSIFIQLHCSLTKIFEDINGRLSKYPDSAYFHAGNSRELISIINLLNDFYQRLFETQYAFMVDDYYNGLLKVYSEVLQPQGATFPAETQKVNLYYKTPIFVMRKHAPVSVATPTITKIDRDYIRSLSERAMKDINEDNYGSAITKSRTLLEEVFCYVIEKRSELPSDSGDIGRLYKQVKMLYKMHQDKEMDKRVNMLLSGLEKIVSAVAQMRNEGSDSHGVGAKRINIKEYHARLFLNSAASMADFILSVSENAL